MSFDVEDQRRQQDVSPIRDPKIIKEQKSESKSPKQKGGNINNSPTIKTEVKKPTDINIDNSKTFIPSTGTDSKKQNIKISPESTTSDTSSSIQLEQFSRKKKSKSSKQSKNDRNNKLKQLLNKNEDDESDSDKNNTTSIDLNEIKRR